MLFEVLKPMTWDGREVGRGDTIEIPDDNDRVGSLARAKFLRLAGPAKAVAVAEPPAPTRAKATDPRQIVREAKAKAGK